MHDLHKCSKCLSISEDMSHILYIYNEIDKYVDNAVSFILEGLVKNEAILFIETEELIERIKRGLLLNGLEIGRFKNVIFTDSIQAYLTGGQLNVKSDEGLIHLLLPFLKEGYTIRTWGRLPLPEYDSTLEKLRIYESKADYYNSRRKAISVCAYNGLIIPAYIQNELLKTHTHFMTDNDIQLSPLYNRENLHFPTNEEMERLRRLEKQINELKERNQHLTYENNLVKVKSEMVMQNEQKIRNIIDQLPIPTIMRRKDNVLFLNGIARKEFGIENGAIEKDHELHPFFEKCDQDIVSCGNGSLQLKQHDKEKYFLVKSIEIVFEGNTSILHSFVDVTQEKENEKLMIRSEKMNIAGELAASIAHELRNPLTAIKGFFHMLKRTGQGNEMYYSVIEEELSRIEQISSELLTLARPHSNNRKNYNIIQLIDDVILLLTPQANMKNLEILLNAERREMYLLCENTKIKQVFINLIKNAIDAMENGGNIFITVKETAEYMKVQIIDQGIGIPKELLHKIGEPFYTTKEKGTGIGMMVCFQIIESHGGTIRVDSEVNVGTTFTITLPKEESTGKRDS